MSMPVLAVSLLLVFGSQTAQQPPGEKVQKEDGKVAVNRDAQIQKEFLDRVSDYVELRNSEEKKLPSLSDSSEPEAITAHKSALLKAMQRARSTAKPGDLFTAPTRAFIRRQVGRTASKPGSSTRAAIQEENPGKINIAINGEYPTSIPLPTVPPQVLAALPRLPDEQLEFRFLGSRLILLDAQANMVVDYMDRALP